MTERRQLLALLDRLPPDDEVVLATVVRVEGSAYRRPGARMLIPRYGRSIGTLSGGCLESEVSKKAWYLTEGGRAVVCRYSTASLSVTGPGTGAEEDAIDTETDAETELAFGLGCNGTVHVLLQRLPVQAPLFARLRAVEQGRAPAAQAIVIEKTGDWAANVGESTAIGVEPSIKGDFVDPALTQAVKQELAALTVNPGRSQLLQWQAPDGAALTLLMEALMPPPALIIVGAGHDAEPLVRLAALMGWRVTVIDGRRHFARPERFPEAEQVLCLSVADAAALAEAGSAAVVIMSHSFSQDRDWLRYFLSKSPPYLGQLGPKSRTDRLLGELALNDDPSLRRATRQLRAPVGLDLGGSTPEAVALAILAEAQAALNGRLGGPLADRAGSIHSAEPMTVKAWPGPV